MSTISEKEADLLKQLRENLADLNLDDEQNSDAFLIRWLRARELSVSKASKMLRDSLQWRKDNNIDSILEWKTPEIYHKLSPIGICGYDHEGRPVVVFPSRFFDIELFWELEKEEHQRYTVQNLEKILAAMKKYSTPEKPVTQFVGIYDLEGFNFRDIMNRRGTALMRENAELVEANYPELIHRAYAVYAPKIFTILFSMMKHFIPKRTIDKFEIHDSNKEKWILRLQEQISPEILPPRLGGTNEDFERTAFAGCGFKPSDRKVSINGEIEIDGFIESHVSAGKTLNYEYDIESPNSTITWCFKTEYYDIGFSVTYAVDDGEVEVVVPYQRVEAQHKKQHGVILCQKVGKYSLIFDNTFSRLRAKTLHLKVEIEAPFCDVLDENAENNHTHS